jgi:hypothetical protein
MTLSKKFAFYLLILGGLIHPYLAIANPELAPLKFQLPFPKGQCQFSTLIILSG